MVPQRWLGAAAAAAGWAAAAAITAAAGWVAAAATRSTAAATEVWLECIVSSQRWIAVSCGQSASYCCQYAEA
jgi:hypothetical protein